MENHIQMGASRKVRTTSNKKNFKVVPEGRVSETGHEFYSSRGGKKKDVQVVLILFFARRLSGVC
jgi:hypothetical protein